MVRTEGEDLEAVRPSLEGARDLRRDTDRVEGTNLKDLIAGVPQMMGTRTR